MRELCDYMIIQRDSDGFGRVTASGVRELAEGNVLVCCVMREDDNTMIVPWQKCETDGKNWKIELTVPEGGPYRVEVRCAAKEETASFNRYDWCSLVFIAKHVGVGDIFIMAGQSNMSGYGRDPAYDPPQLGVHLFDNRGEWDIASHPLSSVPEPADANNDDASGVSPGLAFGKMMQKRLGVPVGLVSAARGGSSLEWWNPAEEDHYLFDALQKKVEAIGKFKAMIWYQGCNETVEQEESDTYLEKFKQAVSLWREAFGYFPIVTCQINRHAWKGEDRERRWGLVREAQRQAALQIPDCFVVPTIDMTTIDGIHNSSASCIVIGERMASTMLKGCYGMAGAFAPNVVSVKKLDSRTVLLKFKDTHMLRTMDDLAHGINIEDEKGMMDCVQIMACDEGAKVVGERDIEGEAVFHAYWQREVPSFLIRDIYGMPMLACYNVKIGD